MPRLAHDVSMLIRLKARHGWVEFARWYHVTGSDPINDASAVDRLYQVYVALLFLAALFLTWLSALDYAATIGAAIGIDTCLQIASLLWIAPLAFFAFLLIRHLRSCPVKMTHPDILWLAPNLNPASWPLSGLALALPLSLMLGALVGFFVGTALQLAVSPSDTSMLFALSAAGATALSRALGMTRHLMPGLPLKIDARSLVRANALYADLQPLRAWAAHAPGAYEEAKRRKLMASRRPFLELPDLQGRKLLIARAALSLARQREGIPKLIVWGACVIPLGAIVASSAPAMWAALAWIVTAASLIPASREMTRVFSDDTRVRIVGDFIAVPRFELLLMDSLPATALVVLASSLVIIAAWALGALSANAMAAFAIEISLILALLFAGGISPSAHGAVRRGPTYDLLVLGQLMLVAILSLANPALAAVAGCAYAAFLGVLYYQVLQAPKPLAFPPAHSPWKRVIARETSNKPSQHI